MVEVPDFTDGASNATGNRFSGAANIDGADMRSDQAVHSQVNADTRLDVAVQSGAVTRLSTTASGNYAQASANDATVTGVYSQTATASAGVIAHSHSEAPTGTVGYMNSYVQGSANGLSVGLDNATATIGATQSNAATVITDGGGVYGRVDNTASFAATTAGNDVTLSGAEGSSAQMVIGQSNTAPLTQAGQFTAFGAVQEAWTSAVAAGNNANLYNDNVQLGVTANQTNQAYVRAQTGSSAYQYGAAYATAQGVGNALVAGDIGDELVLDTIQLNEGGGIEAIARFDGAQGYDAEATAMAQGNSVLGYGCSDCEARVDFVNSQANNADVGAQSYISVAGGRSATGTANAVGNSATYLVSRPSGQ